VDSWLLSSAAKTGHESDGVIRKIEMHCGSGLQSLLARNTSDAYVASLQCMPHGRRRHSQLAMYPTPARQFPATFWTVVLMPPCLRADVDSMDVSPSGSDIVDQVFTRIPRIMGSSALFSP